MEKLEHSCPKCEEDELYLVTKKATKTIDSNSIIKCEGDCNKFMRANGI